MTKWELKHEELLKQMHELLGVYPGSPDNVIQEAYDKATPEVKAKYDELKCQDDEAVAKAEKQL